MSFIISNLIATLKRYRLASIFNILGLSVAFAAFIIIMIQVRYEYSFDRFYPASERIFRADIPTDDIFSVILPRPFVESIIVSSPHIEEGTIINPFIGDVYITTNENGNKNGFRQPFVTCSPGITRVFGFEMVEGEPDCLVNPDHVIIPQSMAYTLFGNTAALGKSIHCEESVWSKDRPNLIIGGVYKDLPHNSQLNNVIYTAMDKTFAMDNWGASNYLCYLLLDNKDAAGSVADNFNKTFDYSKMDWEDSKKQMFLTPLTDIYFKNEMQDGNILKCGNKQSTDVIFCIALLVIAIAAINFMNFSTALAPIRIKSINTQKVLGCSTNFIRCVIVIEGIAIAFISFLLSVFYVWLLGKTNLLSFISADLSLGSNWPLIGIAGLVAVITGFLAGLYPSFYMTSFSPALVIKGNFGVTPAGKKLRTVLIGFQFIISIALIIAASFIWMQSKYMQNYSLGFDKEQIAVVELNKDIFEKHRSTYENDLKEYNGIEDVAFSGQKIGSRDAYSTSGITYNEETFSTYVINVSSNFMKVMGIPLIEGRESTLADETNEKYIFLVNKSIHDKFGVVSTPSINIFGKESSIIGVTGDVKFSSLRQQSDNIMFMTNIQYPLTVSYVRLKRGTDYFTAVEHIRTTLAKIDPAFPFKVEFYDSLFDQLYKKEESFRKMITIFCLLAIIISIVGVFGLVIFETEYRRKEIGIRKVFGAEISNILSMFNIVYIRILLICFVIAVPVVYYFIQEWLKNFVYKIPVYWWLFAISGLIIFAITLLVVNFQCWRAASANPIDSIKSE